MSPGIVTRLEDRILAIAFDRLDRRAACQSNVFMGINAIQLSRSVTTS